MPFIKNTVQTYKTLNDHAYRTGKSVPLRKNPTYPVSHFPRVYLIFQNPLIYSPCICYVVFSTTVIVCFNRDILKNVAGT